MKEMNALSVAAAVNGQLMADENIMVTNVSTDTRTLPSGSLFVAIRGERFDGHDYAGTAIQNGAVLVLADKNSRLPEPIPAIYVDDTVEALGRLAAFHRSRFNIPVIAVTGSVGKTSTKEMIASVLSGGMNVHKTKGNFNNEIGLPLSVLELDDTHEAAVFELGMRGFGEISYLSKIVRPDIAVLTNIGISHIERLGSRQNILKAKLEILEGMTGEGTVILNGDDELLSGLKGLLNRNTLFYGTQEDFDVYAYNLNSMGEKGVAFTIQYNEKELELIVPVPGMHHVHNALSAIAVARKLGLSAESIREGLLSYSGERMRMHIEERKGIKVINDSYNAAPASVSSAISVLIDVGEQKRTWAVLGDMLELGSWAEHAHRDIGSQVAQSGVDFLVAVGDFAKWYVDGALENGMDPGNAVVFAGIEAAKPFIMNNISTGDVMLFKGSRKMKLDLLVEEIFI